MLGRLKWFLGTESIISMRQSTMIGRTPGFAVAENPLGPYTDARGTAPND